MRLIFEIKSVQYERRKIKLTLVDILTGRIYNDVIVSDLERKRQLETFCKSYNPEIHQYVVGNLRKSKKEEKWYLNAPYKFLRREEIEGTIYDPKIVEKMIKVAKRKGYYVAEDMKYTDGFRVYWLQKGYLRIRLGIPISYDGYAIWILVYIYNEDKDKWMDRTPRIDKYSRRMNQKIAKYRIFHSNKNPIKKFEKILNEIERRFRYAIERGKQTRIDAYFGAKVF